VLGGHDDGVDGDRPVVLVDDRDLGLAVGTEVGHRAVLAHRRQPAGEPVRQGDGQRHQLGGLVGGVAEHQALVAGPLSLDLVLGRAGGARLVGGVHALRDVGRLRADGHADAAGRAVEALAGGVVADPEDGVADDRGDVDVAGGRDLTGDVHLTGRDHGLDGHAAGGVLGQHRVQDRVADLVGDLVRVALGDRLGGEETAWHAGTPWAGGG
jgi:hypothetical protein